MTEQLPGQSDIFDELDEPAPEWVRNTPDNKTRGTHEQTPSQR